MNLKFFAKLFGLFVLGLVVVFIIDPLDKSTVSTPFLLGIILTALSLRQSIELVVATSLFYAALTVYELLLFIEFVAANVHPVQHPYFWLFQRAGLFFVVCALAIYLAHYRTSTQRILVHIQDILAKLPTPVVISDASGFIIYANEAIGKIFKRKASQLTGLRYVDFLMSDIQEGKATRYYIEIFGDKTNEVHELEVRPMGNEKMKARLSCLGTGTNRVLITAFDLLHSPARSESVSAPVGQSASR
jgi:PAS domain-containing protein